MAARPRVLIVGGYGTFGRHLARAARSLPVDLVVAGRDLDKASKVAREVDGEAMRLDLRDIDAVAGAATGSFAVVCTAGPFHELDRRLPGVVATAGAHWLDTADEASWIFDVIDLSESPSASILPGLSSTPAITGALASWCTARIDRATHVRVSLIIGNRNVKGAASVASVLATGLRDPTLVPSPWGERRAYRFPSADRELLRRSLGVDAQMRVALEWRPAGMAAAGAAPVVARLHPRARGPAVRALAAASRPFSIFGTPGGLVQAEAWNTAGRSIGAALVSARQDLAILPCVVALEELLGGRVAPGVREPLSILTADDWIARLCAQGLRFFTRGAR